jgi:hypothetical protein
MSDSFLKNLNPWLCEILNDVIVPKRKAIDRPGISVPTTMLGINLQA